MKRNWILIALAGLLLASPVQASLVTLEMEVNNGTSPVTIQLGQTVSVKLYATVTQNNYSGTDLGLTFYAANILTSGGILAPVPGVDPFSHLSDGQWAVTWAVPDFAARARGNVSGDDVLGHGAGLTTMDATTDAIAVSRTLLATGYFQGVSPGTTTLSLGNTQANVMWYNSGFEALAANTVNTSAGVQVNVVPEPATLGLLMLGLAGLGCRRWSRNRRGARA